MGNTKNSAARRVFNDIYSFPQDLQDLGDDLYDAFTTFVGTTSDRNGLPAARLRTGMEFRETNTGYVWRYDGAGWILIYTGIFGRVTRANTTIPMATNAWVDASPSANWTADVVRGGLAAYNNGWVAPIAGRYRVNYELRGSGSFAAGVSVNKAAPATSEVVLTQSAALISGVIAHASSSGVLTLAAGDQVRLLAISASGTPGLEGSRGAWSIEWIGRA